MDNQDLQHQQQEQSQQRYCRINVAYSRKTIFSLRVVQSNLEIHGHLQRNSLRLKQKKNNNKSVACKEHVTLIPNMLQRHCLFIQVYRPPKKMEFGCTDFNHVAISRSAV